MVNLFLLQNFLGWRCMHSKFSLLLSVFYFTLASGCGTGSLYTQAYYSDTELGDNVRRVTFRGGNHPVTGDLCLLRCAEVTLESGNAYFQIVDSESGSNIDQIGSAYPFDRHYYSDTPFLHEVSSVTKTIRILAEDVSSGFAYDAREVSRSMRKKYDISR